MGLRCAGLYIFMELMAQTVWKEFMTFRKKFITNSKLILRFEYIHFNQLLMKQFL